MTNKFFFSKGPFNLDEIIEATSTVSDINPDDSKNIIIHNVSSITKAAKDDITFLSNLKYREQVYSTQAKACIMPFGMEIHSLPLIPLYSQNPYYSYSKVLEMFYGYRKHYEEKICNNIFIDTTAKIGTGCYIGHNVVIEEGADIGNDVVIESNSYIGPNVQIGTKSFISSNVSIECSIIGSCVRIDSGCRIGQAGFGFATDNGRHYDILHTGKVMIGNDCVVGSNTTIDRGSLEDTIIGQGVRIDNLVQIGHNVKIGKFSVIVSQVGIAGSTVIGENCVIAGQAGLAGHLKIGDNVNILAKSGVTKNIENDSVIAGMPAVPVQDWRKTIVMLKKLIKK